MATLAKNYRPSIADIQRDRKSRMGAIGAMQKQLCLDDETLRELMHTVTGKRSRREMSLRQLTEVRDALVKRGGKLTKPGGGGRGLSVDGQSKKLRALWLRGAQLGIIKSADESALCSWASNSRSPAVTTSLDLIGVDELSALIERLKKWLFRAIMHGEWHCSEGHAYPLAANQVQLIIRDNRLDCPDCNDIGKAVKLLWRPKK